MKLTNKEVIDLMVFDINGKLVTKLDTLKDSQIFYDQHSEKYYIGVNDAVFNFDLHKFLHEEENLSDFELAKKGFKKTLRIKKVKPKKCKLIGKTFGIETDQYKDTLITFEAHNAEITNELGIGFSSEKLYDFDYVFQIDLDESGDFLKLHFS